MVIRFKKAFIKKNLHKTFKKMFVMQAARERGVQTSSI